ncbi:hypothetical protein CR201_G0051207 [Pongo abelii]|uniref:Uncharacterized protein n=1 Tax=Pongo abelii TaxID=9601 RepID=A0A2J8RGA0_PONAB|nr:hypothetical protein CR201_G0051207 [Pongo abelii]
MLVGQQPRDPPERKSRIPEEGLKSLRSQTQHLVLWYGGTSRFLACNLTHTKGPLEFGCIVDESMNSEQQQPASVSMSGVSGAAGHAVCSLAYLNFTTALQGK